MPKFSLWRVSAQNPHQRTLETYQPRLPGINNSPFASLATGKRDQNKMPTDADNKRQAARDVIDILEDISKILVCSLALQFTAREWLGKSPRQANANSWSEHQPKPHRAISMCLPYWEWCQPWCSCGKRPWPENDLTSYRQIKCWNGLNWPFLLRPW